MRVLIRDRMKNLYYVNDSTWTNDLETARDFRTTAVAFSFASQHGFPNAEILLSFEDPRFNCTIPVSLPKRST